MPARGNFDDIIRQQQARAKDDTMYRRLKMQEKIMEPLPKNRPQVLMEPDKQEYDYPETRKYDYTKKYGPAPTPPAQPPEVVPKYKGAMDAYSQVVPGGAWNDNPDAVGSVIQSEDMNNYKDSLLDQWIDMLRDKSLPSSVLPQPMSPDEIADLKRRYMK